MEVGSGMNNSEGAKVPLSELEVPPECNYHELLLCNLIKQKIFIFGK